ncbi:MAG: alpha/beta hydrolase [Flavobacteriaceae bacterium]
MIKRIVSILLILYLMLIAALTFFQENLIFLPSKLEPDYTYTFKKPFEEINLTAADGALLNAIHFKTENPKGVLLYFHGNAGDLSRWGEITSRFTEFNLDVLVMDYRSYGKSTGTLSEELLYSDAQLFYGYLTERYNESDITVYGRSLGSTFATYVAANNNPGKLILETPFYSLISVAKKRFPIVPVGYLIKYEFKTHEFIKEVNCDIYFFHGTKDNVVPYSSAEKLFKETPSNKKQFITIPDGNHNNLATFEKYKKEIKRTLE